MNKENKEEEIIENYLPNNEELDYFF